MGDKYKQEAEKALQRTTIFGFGKMKKHEDAVENYNKAGNSYKMSNQFAEAAEMYMEAAKNAKLTDSPNDAANMYVEAGNCYKKSNPLDAVNAFMEAVLMYQDNMRNSQVARYYKEIAEIYENAHEINHAVEFYQKAANAHEADHKKSAANQMLLKVANLSSVDGDKLEAAKIYERLGTDGLESKLGQYSVKGYYLQAGLCILAAGDNVLFAQKFEAFKNSDHNFPSSRECNFLQGLSTAIENFNSEEFADVCAEFDKITPLDPWKTSMLVKIKRNLTEMGEEETDLT